MVVMVDAASAPGAFKNCSGLLSARCIKFLPDQEENVERSVFRALQICEKRASAIFSLRIDTDILLARLKVIRLQRFGVPRAVSRQ